MEFTAPQPPRDAVLNPVQGAVWAITDAMDLASDQIFVDASREAAQLLADAGITFDAALFAQTPHFANPNAAAPETSAVTPHTVLPPMPVDASPPPAEPLDGPVRRGRPRLLAARITAGVRAHRPLPRLHLAVVGSVADDAAEVTLLRRGARRGRQLGRIVVGVAPSLVTLPLPRLAAGRYRVVLRGSGWRRTLQLRVTPRSAR